jgi:homoserine dehydrogenase
MTAMAAREDVDVVVELVGGSDGPALTLARNTLNAGKDLVTANKAMIANHGLELADLAEKADAALKFEAAVAGGIPVIKGLKEGVAANEIRRVYGILNGTCNYILSTMEDTGRDFADVLAEAQAKGYAEADPTFDIDGIDAAHKLAILSSVAFGTKIDFKGVDHRHPPDRRRRYRPGRRAGLLHPPDRHGRHRSGCRWQPPPVPARAAPPRPPRPSARPCRWRDQCRGRRRQFRRPPAVPGPRRGWADRQRGGGRPHRHRARRHRRAFSIPVAELAEAPGATGHRIGSAYLRFTVADRPGALAEITAAMRDAGVSIESLIQKGTPGAAAGDADTVLVHMVTHDGPESAITQALALLDGSPCLTSRRWSCRSSRNEAARACAGKAPHGRPCGAFVSCVSFAARAASGARISPLAMRSASEPAAAAASR